MAEKKENLGFRALPDRAQELRVIATSRKTSVQSMLEKGLELYLARSLVESAISPVTASTKQVKNQQLGRELERRLPYNVSKLQVIRDNLAGILRDFTDIIGEVNGVPLDTPASTGETTEAGVATDVKELLTGEEITSGGGEKAARRNRKRGRR